MLLIKNGEIVTADSRYRADIWCEGETITRIGPDLPAPAGAEVIDAAGKYVFPGFIDPARPHLPAVHGHVCQGHLRHRQPRGTGRRHDHADRDGLPQPRATTRWRRTSCGSRKPPGGRPATTRFTWA